MSNSGLIGKKIGNYVVISQIGAGGMGAVYAAQHPQLDRRVAIKVLHGSYANDPRIVERFLTEAKAITRIKHPNIIDVFDLGQLDDGQIYYVMELLQGQELLSVMKAHGPMSAEVMAPYAQQISGALQAAHDAGIVHRDLKPSNIIVERASPIQLKLLDFGIAKMLQQDGGTNATCTGLVLGTPATMAPEQAAGHSADVGPQTDLYSLGVTMFWMLTGRPPFNATISAVVRAQHITTPPPRLSTLVPGINPQVEAIVHQCLEKRAEDRPASAADVAMGIAGAVACAYGTTVPRLGSALTGPLPRPVTSVLSGSRPESAAQWDGHGLPTTLVEDVPGLSVQTATGEGQDQAQNVSAGRHHTTLGGAAGEVSQYPHLHRPSTSRWRWPLLAAAVALAGIFSAVAIFGPTSGPSVSNLPTGQASSVQEPPLRTSRSAGNPPIKGATPARAQGDSPPTAHSTAGSSRTGVTRTRILSVNVVNAPATCELTADGTVLEEQPAPCRFEIASGRTLSLTVRAKGYRRYSAQLTMHQDQAIGLAADDAKQRIVPQGDAKVSASLPPTRSSAVASARKSGAKVRSRRPHAAGAGADNHRDKAVSSKRSVDVSKKSASDKTPAGGGKQLGRGLPEF
jgi:serine/threonine protein kinase